jgi:quercetin dioxygenase-like cupin family protein
VTGPLGFLYCLYRAARDFEALGQRESSVERRVPRGRQSSGVRQRMHPDALPLELAQDRCTEVVPSRGHFHGPWAFAKHYPRNALIERLRGDVRIRSLLPDKIAGMEIDRMELPPLGHMVGVPHTPGTREYLTCEVGEIVLTVAGESYALSPGDVVVFRGDQKHAYRNPARSKAVSYSIVVLAPVTA